MLRSCRPPADLWRPARSCQTALRAHLLRQSRLISHSSWRCKAQLQETAPLSEEEVKQLPVNSLDTPVLAEALGLDIGRLGRLILNGASQKVSVKLGRKGVSKNLKTQLETRFRNLEVVKLEATEKQQKANMKVIRTQLEELMPIHVIWMSGSKIVAYRGKDYVKLDPQPPLQELQTRHSPAASQEPG